MDAAVPPDLEIHLVLDNYGTHKTALVHRWLAKRPRYHLHFTPTSASWLNLVERWFAALTEKQLRRGLFRSTRELETAIMRYLGTPMRTPNPSSRPRQPTAFWPRQPTFADGYLTQGNRSRSRIFPAVPQPAPP